MIYTFGINEWYIKLRDPWLGINESNIYSKRKTHLCEIDLKFMLKNRTFTPNDTFT